MRLFVTALLVASFALPLKAKELMPAVPSYAFAKDLHDKNLTAIMKLFTRDAVFVGPDGHKFMGADAIRALNAQVMAKYDSNLHLKMASLSQNGDTAVDEGSWTETLRDRATGKVMQSHGTYRFTARHQLDGRWLFSLMQWTQAR